MATIGLDKLYYAKITEGVDGTETYETPKPLAPAISAELGVELNEAMLYADDGINKAVKEFKNGTLSIGIADIGHEAASDLTGAVIDKNGAVISHAEGSGAPVAIGFRALKDDKTYRYFWLYRVQFGVPGTNLTTKGESIEFSTPTVEGTIMRRNKADGKGKHPWKAEMDEGNPESASAIKTWYTEVYEPVYNPEALEEPVA